MNTDSNIFWLAVTGIVVVVSAAVAAFARWCFFSPAVSFKKMNQLHVGMDQQAVRALLGDPWHTRSRRDHREWWFGHPVKKHILVVRFNGHNHVTQFQHEAGYHHNRQETT